MKIGDRIRILVPVIGHVITETDEVLRHNPVGTICEVVLIEDLRPPQGRAVTVLAPNGVHNTFDEEDGEGWWEPV